MRGLYVHIPFCVKKCKYCDFISFSGCEDKISEYIEAVICEMNEYKGEELDTVFIGGGTPSLMNEDCIIKLMNAIKKNFILSDDCEISIESNPKTLTEEKLKVMIGSGINRISIGVQSFIDKELRKIGRIHNAKDAEEAFMLARNAGFKNINLDIMFSLPDEEKTDFLKTLEKTVSLLPEHISCYSLILEENTPLFSEYEKGDFKFNSDEKDRDLYETAIGFLEKSGYYQYEISNFSKKGYECKHNLKYWETKEYIGIGLAAHSYYKRKRFSNTDDLEEYLKRDFSSRETEFITKEEEIKEYIIMGLRKTDGISIADFFDRFGLDFYEEYRDITDKFIKMGLLEKRDGNIKFTLEGINVSNSVLCEFV